METFRPRYTLSTLAQLLGGEPDGPPDIPLDHPVSAGDDDLLGVAFAENEQYLSLAEGNGVGAVIVHRSARESSKPLIRVDEPRAAFGLLLALAERPMSIEEGVHPAAIISQSAKIDPSARIGPYTVIESGSSVGPRARIHPFCYIGEDCHIGVDAILYPHVVLYRDVQVGDRSVLHSGVVLGADGFGYVWDGQRRVKVPQVGSVEIGHEVEIGANTTVDRATAGRTRLGSGTKLDNLVQIAHNVEIGDHTVIAAQSGISGSVKIGHRVVMGGNVGTTDHVTIADDVVLGGRSSVDRDIDEAGAYFGTPARTALEAKRSLLLFTRLPELISRIRDLEKKLKAIEKGK